MPLQTHPPRQSRVVSRRVATLAADRSEARISAANPLTDPPNANDAAKPRRQSGLAPAGRGLVRDAD